MAALHDVLLQRGHSVATAESLTAGRLVAALTSVPGSSRCIAGGAVTYFARTKHEVLGVSDQLVERHGTVSAECAAAMAQGVRVLFDTTFGVSTTGVAGPDSEEGKPVGLAFVAVAGPAGVEVRALNLVGDRSQITDGVVEEALSLLADFADGAPGE